MPQSEVADPVAVSTLVGSVSQEVPAAKSEPVVAFVRSAAPAEVMSATEKALVGSSSFFIFVKIGWCDVLNQGAMDITTRRANFFGPSVVTMVEMLELVSAGLWVTIGVQVVRSGEVSII